MSNKYAILMHSHWDFDDDCYLAVGFDDYNYFFIQYCHLDPEPEIRDSTINEIYKVSPGTCNYLARRCKVKVEGLVDYFVKHFPRGKQDEDEFMELFDYSWIGRTRDAILNFLDDLGVQYVKYDLKSPPAILDFENYEAGQRMKVTAFTSISLDLRIKCEVYDKNDLLNQGTLIIDIYKTEAYLLCDKLKTSISRLAWYFYRRFRRFEDEDFGIEEATYTVENILNLLKRNNVNYRLIKAPRY